MLEKHKTRIDRDLQKLEKSVVPKYQEAMSKIEAGKDNVRKNSQKLKTALHKQGEALHKEIDAVIKTMESSIDLMDCKLLAEMNKQEDSMKHIINEIKQVILHLKTLQDTYDICIVSKYESRNEEFSRLPALFQVTLHKFVPRQINSKEIIQQIGLLSEQNIKNLAEWAIEPTVVTKFDTEYKKNALRSVSCQSYTELWTLGWEDCMRLYNLRGELLKSVPTNSNQTPHDIAVLRNGDLAYTDYHGRSINMVKKDGKHIHPSINLQGWMPRYLCKTYYGDFLVIVDSDDKKQTKIMRYFDSTEKQSIQWDDQGLPLYTPNGTTIFLTENKNLDICVADAYACAVVVVSAVGQLRFRYYGHQESFKPTGITTDSQGMILISDFETHLIHILDENGNFSRYIDNCDVDRPHGLCVDFNDSLFVAEHRGKVKKIQYYK